jgi:hypothetical protein
VVRNVQIVRVGGALAFVGLIRLNKLMGMIEFIELKVDSSWLTEWNAPLKLHRSQ